MDFEKTLEAATDSIILNPKLDLFRSLAQMMTSRPSAPKECIVVIKKRLRNKQPRTQLLTLELIEYLTCVCSQNVHTVFHDKEFLQQLNTMLSQNTSDELRNKILHIIQFWGETFKNESDIFPNFTKMYMRAVQSGIKFPPMVRSQYSNMEKVEAPQTGYSMESGNDGYQKPQIWDNSPSRNKTPQVLKVEGDLQAFLNSIDEADMKIKRGDLSKDTQDHLKNLMEMGSKLPDLVLKLKAAGEYDTADKANDVQRRLGIVVDSFQSRRNGNTQQPPSQFGFEFNAGGSAGHPQGGARPGQFTSDNTSAFEDFNRVAQASGSTQTNTGFGGFNTFGQPAQPPAQTSTQGGGFWDTHDNSTQSHGAQNIGVPKAAAGGDFWSSQGNAGQTQPRVNEQPAGNTFFGGSAPTQQTQPQCQPQKPAPANDELNLLGLDPTQPPKPATPAQPTQTPNTAAFDLLGGARPGNPTTATAGHPAQHGMTGIASGTNPFSGPDLAATANPLQLQQQQMMRMMQMNMMNMNPMMAAQQMQQMMAMNPLMAQQLLAMNPMMGQGVQPTLGATPTLGGAATFGATGAGQPHNSTFGTSNSVSFAQPPQQQQDNKRTPATNDLFADLSSDLI